MNTSKQNLVKVVIALAGGSSSLARALGLTPTAVMKWGNNGKIPPTRVIPVSAAIKWIVTPHQLRPDCYPFPTDGLPDRAAGDSKLENDPITPSSPPSRPTTGEETHDE
ncbi:transcriptional regulator [Acidithiobacillus sp.]|uniref:transcriptional regulator n=1 Tax=Acidithiobacillus sp. TaxID=1872118 RepID=UPI003D092069